MKENLEENLALQRQLYGDTLGNIFSKILQVLNLTQRDLAQIVGISPPMLSQLMSGLRVKIANPMVASRVMQMMQLAQKFQADQIEASDLANQIKQISASTQSLSMVVGSDKLGEEIHKLLRACASGEEIDLASKILKEAAPNVCEFIRILGLKTAVERDAYINKYRKHLNG